jgi:hypothetical protein
MLSHPSIQKIRERPHHERHTIAVTVAIVVTALVGIVWLTLFFRHLASSPAPAVGTNSIDVPTNGQ